MSLSGIYSRTFISQLLWMLFEIIPKGIFPALFGSHRVDTAALFLPVKKDAKIFPAIHLFPQNKAVVFFVQIVPDKIENTDL